MTAGYTWADPQASAKKWLPELRKECDFLIVLACLPAREAVQLAVDNSNIDIIMSGFKHQMSGLPARINQSTILYAEDEGKTSGRIALFSDSRSKGRCAAPKPPADPKRQG